MTIFYFLSVATFGAVENFLRTWLCWKRRCRVFVSPNWLLKHGRCVQVFVLLPGEVDFVYSSLATKARVHSAMKLRKSPFLGISFPSVTTEKLSSSHYFFHTRSGHLGNHMHAIEAIRKSFNFDDSHSYLVFIHCQLQTTQTFWRLIAWTLLEQLRLWMPWIQYLVREPIFL